VVDYLHLCPGGPAYESAFLHNKKQGKCCLEIPFPRSHNVWELSALGIPIVMIIILREMIISFQCCLLVMLNLWSLLLQLGDFRFN
jgi:hypothetical protein